MSAVNRLRAIEEVRAHIFVRLGIEILEFYEPAELIEKWLDPELAAGRSPVEVGEAIAIRFYEKYDLEWLSNASQSGNTL